MFRLCFILAVSCACAAALKTSPENEIPPYAQLSEAFSHAKLYIREHFPAVDIDIKIPEHREYHAFGIAAVVVSDVLLKGDGYYGPINSFERWVPWVWENYKQCADAANKYINEAQEDLDLLLQVINTECMLAETLDDCNERVDNIVKKHSDVYEKRAKLLIRIGNTAQLISGLSVKVEELKKDYALIPYLLHNLGGPELDALSSSIFYTYISMSQIPAPK